MIVETILIVQTSDWWRRLKNLVSNLTGHLKQLRLFKDKCSQYFGLELPTYVGCLIQASVTSCPSYYSHILPHCCSESVFVCGCLSNQPLRGSESRRQEDMFTSDPSHSEKPSVEASSHSAALSESVPAIASAVLSALASLRSTPP